MDSKIKFFGVLRLQDNKILYSEGLNPSKTSDYTADFNRLSSVLSTLDLGPADYQKIHTSNGTWYCVIDNKRTSFNILAHPNYSVASILRLLKMLQAEIQSIENYSSDEGKISDKMGTFAGNLMKVNRFY